MGPTFWKRQRATSALICFYHPSVDRSERREKQDWASFFGIKRGAVPVPAAPNGKVIRLVSDEAEDEPPRGPGSGTGARAALDSIAMRSLVDGDAKGCCLPMGIGNPSGGRSLFHFANACTCGSTRVASCSTVHFNVVPGSK